MIRLINPCEAVGFKPLRPRDNMAKDKNKLDLDWMDEIVESDLPMLMQLEAGWHLFHVNLDWTPEMVEIELPNTVDKKTGGPLKVPQLVVSARFAITDEFEEHAIPFWALKPWKQIVQDALDNDKLMDDRIELKVRVTQAEDGKRTAQFKLA